MIATRARRRFLVAILALAVLGPAATVRAELVEIVILHTNDFHSAFEKSDDLITTIRRMRVRYPHSLLLDAGDAFDDDTPAVLATHGRATVDFLNRAGYDAGTLGDNEFKGFDMRDVRDNIAARRFPVLAANLRLTEGGGRLARSWVVFERRGLRIGVIGVYQEESLQPFGITVEDPEIVVRRAMEALRNEADLTVLLSHSGDVNERRIASTVPDIDVVVGGSTHTPIFEPERVGDTLIVRAGSRGQYLGVLRLVIDRESERVVEWEGQLVSTARCASESGPGSPRCPGGPERHGMRPKGRE